MQVYVISIEDNASYRWLKFLDQNFFGSLKKNYHKVGVVGANLAVKQYFEWAVKGRAEPLSPGELGCTLSHLQALKLFLQTTESYALILEDDAILPEFLEYQQLKEELLKFDLPQNVLFSLGGIQMKECLKVRGKFNPKQFLDKKVLTVDPHFYSRACYAFAYIVDKKMAKTLIAYHGKIRKADDWSYLYDFDSSVNLLMTHLVEHPEIERGEADAHLSHLEAERLRSGDLEVSQYGKGLAYELSKISTHKYF